MTNEELDRWLAENVMGLKICDDPDCEGCDNPTVDEDGSIWLDREDYYRPEEWHPTTNIAQAIEAAEKARTKGRIGDWVLLSPAWNSISRPMAEITLDGGFFFSRDADAYSLALCRAIHEALRDRP